MRRIFRHKLTLSKISVLAPQPVKPLEEVISEALAYKLDHLQSRFNKTGGKPKRENVAVGS